MLRNQTEKLSRESIKSNNQANQNGSQRTSSPIHPAGKSSSKLRGGVAMHYEMQDLCRYNKADERPI